MSQIRAVDVQRQRHMKPSEKAKTRRSGFFLTFPNSLRLPSWRWSIFLILSASCASEWV